LSKTIRDELDAARRKRARRTVQAGADLRGYPALHPDEKTEATLAAQPPERAEKKPKPLAPE
jgi:hypothetical protein